MLVAGKTVIPRYFMLTGTFLKHVSCDLAKSRVTRAKKIFISLQLVAISAAYRSSKVL